MAAIRRRGGESGIRIHGPLRTSGFRDRRLKPLSHLSGSGSECRFSPGQGYEPRLSSRPSRSGTPGRMRADNLPLRGRPLCPVELQVQW